MQDMTFTFELKPVNIFYSPSMVIRSKLKGLLDYTDAETWGHKQAVVLSMNTGQEYFLSSITSINGSRVCRGHMAKFNMW